MIARRLPHTELHSLRRLSRRSRPEVRLPYYAARFDPCAFPASADLLAGLPHMPMGVRRTRLMQRARKGVQACLQMGDAPCGRSFGASRRLAWYVILGG